MLPVTLVVAIAENAVIGRDGGLPWRLSSDLKRFRADTLGNPVIMGRKTFDSIGRPLPGRLNIVVTRNADWATDGVERVASLADAITLARVRARCMAEAREISVIGGGQIYAEALPLADRLRVTHILAGPDGDTFFPAIDPEIWRMVRSEAFPAGERDSHATRYVVYERGAKGDG
ncbi:MAG: dihydrofolate reductase [Rhizobiaceae bacterium]